MTDSPSTDAHAGAPADTAVSAATAPTIPTAPVVPATAPAGGGGALAPPAEASDLVQYVIVRGDLLGQPGWSIGSLIGQGAHAAVSAVWQHREDPTVRRYCDLGPHMHLVVLRAENEEQLRKTAEELNTKGIRNSLWTELPENILTALALVPCSRASLGRVLRRFPLFK